MLKPFVVVTAALAAASAGARPAFSGPDFSGVYGCTGNEDHEGKYTGTGIASFAKARAASGHSTSTTTSRSSRAGISGSRTVCDVECA